MGKNQTGWTTEPEYAMRKAIDAAMTKVRQRTDDFLRERFSDGRTVEEAAQDYLDNFVGVKNERGHYYRESHPVLATVLKVRHRAAGNMDPAFSKQFEAYDKGVLAVYHELETQLFSKG